MAAQLIAMKASATRDISDLNERSIVKLAFIAELMMLGIALLWANARGIQVLSGPLWSGIITGALASLPPLIFSIIILELLDFGRKIPGYTEFRNSTIIPICQPLGTASAVAIAMLSGVCEEYFFRGVLNPECMNLLGDNTGLFVGCFLFAFIHFGTVNKHNMSLIIIYIIAAYYFSALYILTEGLTAAASCHAVYNFSVFRFIRWRYSGQAGNESPCNGKDQHRSGT